MEAWKGIGFALPSKAEMRLIGIAVLLLVSVAGLAAPWTVAQGEHFFVFSRDAKLAAELAPIADGVLAQVWAYWLPPEMSENGGGDGPKWLQPKKYVLVVYNDPELYWDDTGAYGTLGVTGSPDSEGWKKTVAPILASAGLEVTAPAVLCYYIPGKMQRIFAHEFTHLLQTSLPEPPDIWFFNPWVRELYLEGMARWTEYALGYGGDFSLEVTQPVLVWLSRGGDLTQEVKNWLLQYSIGASLISAELEQHSPPEVLALLRPAVGTIIGLPRKATFEELFEAEHGLTWMGFFTKWKLSLKLREKPTPAGELVYEFYRRYVGLREEFLWPLLSQERVEEIRALGKKILKGQADEATLSRIETLLSDLHPEPSPEVLQAVEKRREAFSDWARLISGAEAASEVEGLFSREKAGAIPPQAFLEEYVKLVNRFLVLPP